MSPARSKKYGHGASEEGDMMYDAVMSPGGVSVMSATTAASSIMSPEHRAMDGIHHLDISGQAMSPGMPVPSPGISEVSQALSPQMLTVEDEIEISTGTEVNDVNQVSHCISFLYPIAPLDFARNSFISLPNQSLSKIWPKGQAISLCRILLVAPHISVAHGLLFPFVPVDPDFLHSDWLTGVVHETMHHTFGP